jgi:hypothetical protein
MEAMNLIYIAIQANRTAVIPPINPGHLDGSAGSMAFGQVFDLPRLSRAIQHPLVEWYDLKNVSEQHVDRISCWSVWMSAWETPREPTGSWSYSTLHLGEQPCFVLAVFFTVSFI